ncbi:MAG: hypothetical protein OEV31_06210, partial [Gammaproteobacteria bacterium]|nr:hypothetical protein [Gammaproteobacteria bacterium]
MPHRHAIRDEFSVPLDTESGQKIFRQKLNGLYEGSIVGHLATLVNSLLLAFLLWNHAPHTLLISWVSALYGITLVRFVLLRRYRTASLQPDFDSYRWFLVFAIGIGLAGAVWGSAAIWLFPEDSVPHQSFIAFVLAGMTAGAVSHYSILPAASLSFLLPALVPLMVRLLHSGGEL